MCVYVYVCVYVYMCVCMRFFLDSIFIHNAARTPAYGECVVNSSTLTVFYLAESWIKPERCYWLPHGDQGLRGGRDMQRAAVRHVRISMEARHGMKKRGFLFLFALSTFSCLLVSLC